uniref:Uncharacterized protein n=1 Tax=Graphocephala atropunctata TaxID=36148 RepID=A0A1B6MJG9_9HEMI
MSEAQHTWKRYKVLRTVAKARTFQRRKEKMKDAEYCYDLSTDNEVENGKRHRRERARKRIYSCSSPCPSESDDNNLPPYPKLPKNLRVICSPWDKQGVWTNLTESSPSTGEIQHSSSSSVENCDESFPSTSLETPKRRCSSSSRGESTSLKDVLRAISGLRYSLASVVQNQNDMRKRLTRIEKCLHGHADNIGPEPQDHKAEVKINLPMTTDEELEKMEDQLKNESFRIELMLYAAIQKRPLMWR